MEIRNCPECGEDVFSAGMAFWSDGDDLVAIVECLDSDCSWVGIDLEYRALGLPVLATVA